MTSGDDPGEQLDQAMAEIAREAGGTLHIYPRPGRAVREITLRDHRDDRGTQHEAARIEQDGTLRVTGHDTGPAVSEAFGEQITSCEWIYTVAPDRVGDLLRLLGAAGTGDVLTALAAYYEQTGGRLHSLLTSPEVAAGFASWHS